MKKTIFKKFVTMTSCIAMTIAAVTATSFTASAGFSVTPLKYAGSCTYLGQNYSFKNNAMISTYNNAYGQLEGEASVTLYESNGQIIPSVGIFCLSASYICDQNGNTLNGAFATNSGDCVSVRATTSYSGYPAYYAVGYTRIMYNSMYDQYDSSTYQTATIS